MKDKMPFDGTPKLTTEKKQPEETCLARGLESIFHLTAFLETAKFPITGLFSRITTSKQVAKNDLALYNRIIDAYQRGRASEDVPRVPIEDGMAAHFVHRFPDKVLGPYRESTSSISVFSSLCGCARPEEPHYVDIVVIPFEKGMRIVLPALHASAGMRADYVRQAVFSGKSVQPEISIPLLSVDSRSFLNHGYHNYGIGTYDLLPYNTTRHSQPFSDLRGAIDTYLCFLANIQYLKREVVFADLGNFTDLMWDYDTLVSDIMECAPDLSTYRPDRGDYTEFIEEIVAFAKPLSTKALSAAYVSQSDIDDFMKRMSRWMSLVRLPDTPEEMQLFASRLPLVAFDNGCHDALRFWERDQPGMFSFRNWHIAHPITTMDAYVSPSQRFMYSMLDVAIKHLNSHSFANLQESVDETIAALIYGDRFEQALCSFLDIDTAVEVSE